MSFSEALKVAFDAHVRGDAPRAEEIYCKLIATDESDPIPYFGLGTLYAQANALGRAITFLKKSLELKPDNPEGLMNLSAVYRRMEKKDEALRLSAMSLELDRSPLTLSNLAGVYVNDGNPAQALAYADEALSLIPGYPPAGNHRALALLEMGRFTEGWEQYDSRLALQGWHSRPYACPMWKGEKVGTLAISGEQGLGDEVMFLTSLQQVQPFADRIVVECATRLVKLLQNSFPEVAFYGRYEELAAAEKPDAWIHMGSMQRYIWPVKPNAYLRPTTVYPRSKRKRIGLSWRGGTLSTHGVLRNFSMDVWKKLLELDASFISLQYGDHAVEAEALGIPHDAESIADLDLLAAMIKSCDLVISVCNTTIHMAGALGVPCLVLVPSKPAWRYGLTGDSMPWYDSVKLLRQGDDESWSSVIQRAVLACADYGVLPRTESGTASVAA